MASRKRVAPGKSEAIWNAYFIGAVSAIAAIALEFAINHLLPLDRMNPVIGSAAEAVLVAAVPEELIKFFVLVSLAEKHVDVRRLQDILVLALAVSLGFATLENFFYLISAGDWKIAAAIRAITAVPGHGIDGLAMGALLMASRSNGGKSLWSTRYALLVPIALHAAYDFPLFAIHKGVGKIWVGAAWLVVIALSSLFVIALCNRIIPKAIATDRAVGRDGTSIELTRSAHLRRDNWFADRSPARRIGFLQPGLRGRRDANDNRYFPGCVGYRSRSLTGFRRRRMRLAAINPSLDYAH